MWRSTAAANSFPALSISDPIHLRRLESLGLACVGLRALPPRQIARPPLCRREPEERPSMLAGRMSLAIAQVLVKHEPSKCKHNTKDLTSYAENIVHVPPPVVYYDTT
jgi:hypothetical protein